MTVSFVERHKMQGHSLFTRAVIYSKGGLGLRHSTLNNILVYNLFGLENETKKYLRESTANFLKNML